MPWTGKKLDSRRLVTPGCRKRSCRREGTGNRPSLGIDSRQRRRRPNRSYRDFCCRRISSYTVCSTIPIPTSRASRRISRAGRTRCRCEELQIQSARSSPSETSPPASAAARAIIVVQESAPQRVGPCGAPEPVSGLSWQPEQVPWYGSSGRADSSCSGRTDSICDSALDLWKWDLDVAGDYRPRLPEPSLRPTVPLQSRLLFQEHILAHCPSDPRRSIRGSPLTKSDWAFPQEGRAHRVCHHHGPGHCQLLIEER